VHRGPRHARRHRRRHSQLLPSDGQHEGDDEGQAWCHRDRPSGGWWENSWPGATDRVPPVAEGQHSVRHPLHQNWPRAVIPIPSQLIPAGSSFHSHCMPAEHAYCSHADGDTFSSTYKYGRTARSTIMISTSGSPPPRLGCGGWRLSAVPRGPKASCSCQHGRWWNARALGLAAVIDTAGAMSPQPPPVNRCDASAPFT
jgi:hypothetical protein